MAAASDLSYSRGVTLLQQVTQYSDFFAQGGHLRLPPGLLGLERNIQMMVNV
jgi:hypothetical protein